MASCRLPVLVWEDFTGWFTARPIDVQEDVAGTGRTAAEAVAQLGDYFAWLYQQQPWLDAPDFLDLRLVALKVAVRPEYRYNDRVHPCDTVLELRVPCVAGRQQGGLLVGSLPTLGLQFTYFEQKDLRELATRSVQLKLQGLTPRALSLYLPPKSIALDEVVVRLLRKKPRSRSEPTFPILDQVAEPLGERALRRQCSRAWERDEVVRVLVEKLYKEQANVLLVGEPGVGKTTVPIFCLFLSLAKGADDIPWHSSVQRLHATPLAAGYGNRAGTNHDGSSITIRQLQIIEQALPNFLAKR